MGNLNVYWTSDGSPSLIFEKNLEPESIYAEKMHHSLGAWSETKYIYLPAIEVAADCDVFQDKTISVLSLGLGLGYNELMTLALELKRKSLGHPVNFQVHSYEVLSELRRNFLDQLQSGQSQAYSDCYRWIFENIAKDFSIEIEDLKRMGRERIQSGELLLLGSFPDSLPPKQEYEVLLYDAFSKKMSPELWEESFLFETLGRHCAKDCVVSTYAATGALKRSLLGLGFKKILRPGFSGKRDSSFYVRGNIKYEDVLSQTAVFKV